MPYSDHDSEGYVNAQSTITLTDRQVRDNPQSLRLTLADTETYDLGNPDGTTFTFLLAYDEFAGIITTDGTTTLTEVLDPSTKLGITDAGTLLVMYYSGSNLILKNRLGSEKEIVVTRLG